MAFTRKNPINHNSKDPLRPPSQTENYTLFSRHPIRGLCPIFSNKAIRVRIRTACSQQMPKPIICGSNEAVNNWKNIWSSENAIISKSKKFGVALTTLRLWEPNAPYLHTNLDLQEWLDRLCKIGTIEAADAYWGISRGLELLPKTLKRKATSTPNYYKKEHTP